MTEEVVYRIRSEMWSHAPVSDGLVRIRDGKCYSAAPCWERFIGMTEADILSRCRDWGYQCERCESPQTA